MPLTQAAVRRLNVRLMLNQMQKPLLVLVVTLAGAQSTTTPVPPRQTPAQTQPQTQPPTKDESPADVPLLAQDVYKNIQVFHNKPATDVLPAMLAWRHMLGTDCNWCHIAYEWDKDKVKPKQTARMMAGMNVFINNDLFSGKDRVNCWTCHRAQPVPIKFLKPGTKPPQQTMAERVIGLSPDDANKPAEKVFGNIQSLQGIPAGKLPEIMGYFSASLGVKCNFCHVKPFSDDSKPEKLMARKMLAMVGGISKNFYNGGNIDIGCETCHRGQPKPPEGTSEAAAPPATAAPVTKPQ